MPELQVEAFSAYGVGAPSVEDVERLVERAREDSETGRQVKLLIVSMAFSSIGDHLREAIGDLAAVAELLPDQAEQINAAAEELRAQREAMLDILRVPVEAAGFDYDKIYAQAEAKVKAKREAQS